MYITIEGNDLETVAMQQELRTALCRFTHPVLHAHRGMQASIRQAH